MGAEAQKKVFIKTYGCQMNSYDSERMSDLLAPAGYGEAYCAEDADLVILNTCHIREKAAEKVYSELGRLKRIKREHAANGRKMLIAVAGCVAQAEGEEIIRRAPTVDLVFGPQTYQRLPQMLKKSASGPVVETEFPAADKFDELKRAMGPKPAARNVSAFLTIQEGCDKFCTFCVVPYTRGAEFSRPVAQLRAEAQKLADSGVREITLLGQNVNAYHGEGPDGSAWSLGRLLDHLSGVSGIERLRYTTSHPRDMDDDLIRVHGDNPKVMPYLHLPVQAGSDRILAAMNRRHSAQDYLDVVGRIRAARPDIALSSDFIVGFPGESEAEFECTMSLVREVKFAQAYSFKYSPRPGTPAATLPDQVPDTVKSERLARLQELLNEQQTEFNRACMGRKFDVLLEKRGRHEGQLAGRSPYLQAVHLAAGSARIGEIVRVRAESVGINSISAHIVAA